MKISTRRDALFAPAPDRHPRGLHAQRRPGAVRRPAARRPSGGDRAARHRHGDRPARPARGRGRPRGRRRAAGAAARRRRPRAARRRGHARAARRRAGRRDRRRLRDVPHPHAARSRTSRRFPEPEGDGRVEVPGAGVRRDRRQGGALGLARRDAPGADRHPRLRRRRASCGWSRPTPTACRVKETKLEAPLAGLVRGQRAGAGAAGADADRPARRAPRRSRVSVRANQVVFEVGGVVLSSRLIDGQFPNYRQLLPDAYEHELQLAGARDHRRRAPHLAAGAEERAAAAGVHRGRADGLGADAGRRRGARDAAGAVPGRAARDRLQPGVPARRPRGASRRATCCSS